MRRGRPATAKAPAPRPAASWWRQPMTRAQFEATATARAEAARDTRAAALVDAHWGQIGEDWHGHRGKRGV